jgi:hypothetical protein
MNVHVALLRRNAALIQSAFAMFWFVRLAVAAPSPETIAALVAGSALVVRGAVRTWGGARGLRARDEFRTPAGRAFLRPVTRISVAQLVASVVLPWIAAGAGATEWVLPSIAITIGLFLVAFATSLQVPAVRWVGVVATVVPALLPLVIHGAGLAVAVCATLGAALTCSVWLGAWATPSGPRRIGVAPDQLHTAFTFGQRVGNAPSPGCCRPSQIPAKDSRGVPS